MFHSNWCLAHVSQQILNVLLRFAWIQTILDFNFSFMHRQTMVTVVASLEIIRRGIWNFFRWKRTLKTYINHSTICFVPLITLCFCFCFVLGLVKNRLENEHLNNVGKYRAFKSVPLPFNYDKDEDKDD